MLKTSSHKIVMIEFKLFPKTQAYKFDPPYLAMVLIIAALPTITQLEINSYLNLSVYLK